MSWAGEVKGVRDWYPNSFRFDDQDEAYYFIQQLREEWIPVGFIRAVRVQWSNDPTNSLWDYQAQDAIRFDVVDEEKALPAKFSACRCNHDPIFLQTEIAAGRWVHKFQENEIGEYVLTCLSCGGLWDHAATDGVIANVMAPVGAYDTIMIPEDLPIFELWEKTG